MIFDTDVIIWLLKGNVRAAEIINNSQKRFISVITFMELLKVALNKKEQAVIKNMIKNLGLNVLPVDENISHRALIYIEEYGLKTGICVADAFIAATAAEYSLVLCTGNYKDFREIEDIELKVFRI